MHHAVLLPFLSKYFLSSPSFNGTQSPEINHCEFQAQSAAKGNVLDFEGEKLERWTWNWKEDEKKCKQMCQSFLAYFSVWHCENLPELGVMDTEGGCALHFLHAPSARPFQIGMLNFLLCSYQCVSSFFLVLTPFLLLYSFLRMYCKLFLYLLQ